MSGATEISGQQGKLGDGDNGAAEMKRRQGKRTKPGYPVNRPRIVS